MDDSHVLLSKRVWIADALFLKAMLINEGPGLNCSYLLLALRWRVPLIVKVFKGVHDNILKLPRSSNYELTYSAHKPAHAHWTFGLVSCYGKYCQLRNHRLNGRAWFKTQLSAGLHSISILSIRVLPCQLISVGDQRSKFSKVKNNLSVGQILRPVYVK